MRRLRRQDAITLVELLVSMTIMVIISSLIVVGWLTLQNSYSSTVTGDRAQNIARDAVERMRREIRAMQPVTADDASVTVATATEIHFTTAYNDFAANPGGTIRLTRYYYEFDSAQKADSWRIYRQRDTDGNGAFTAADRTILVASNVANGMVPSTSTPTAVFTYTYRDSSGAAHTTTSVTDPEHLKSIIGVQIRVITDVNPTKTPTYFDLVTTVRPRNTTQD